LCLSDAFYVPELTEKAAVVGIIVHIVLRNFMTSDGH